MFKTIRDIRDSLIALVKAQNDLNKTLKEKVTEADSQLCSLSGKYDCLETNVYTKSQTNEAINKVIVNRENRQHMIATNKTLLEFIEQYIPHSDEEQLFELFNKIYNQYDIRKLGE